MRFSPSLLARAGACAKPARRRRRARDDAAAGLFAERTALLRADSNGPPGQAGAHPLDRHHRAGARRFDPRRLDGDAAWTGFPTRRRRGRERACGDPLVVKAAQSASVDRRLGAHGRDRPDPARRAAGACAHARSAGWFLSQPIGAGGSG